MEIKNDIYDIYIYDIYIYLQSIDARANDKSSNFGKGRLKTFKEPTSSRKNIEFIE